MIRTWCSARLAAAVAMFVIGFIFFATPLAEPGLARRRATRRRRRSSNALAANLPRQPAPISCPAPNDRRRRRVMYGQGPIATIHYNTAGFAAMDPATLVHGLRLQLRRRAG